MKFIKQFLIIVTVSLIGELLNKIIPFPIPASIYGLVLMFCALKFKLFPLSAVKETSDYLLEIMPVMFIAPSIAIFVNLDVLKAHWWQLFVISFISTILVMGISGVVTQIIIRLENRGEK